MKNYGFLADLSGIDLSTIYSLENVIGDSRDVYFDINSNSNIDLSDEKVEQILRENGFYRTWN